jgi:hypothetical protein
VLDGVLLSFPVIARLVAIGAGTRAVGMVHGTSQAWNVANLRAGIDHFGAAGAPRVEKVQLPLHQEAPSV